jgi:hypothetical protein
MAAQAPPPRLRMAPSASGSAPGWVTHWGWARGPGWALRCASPLTSCRDRPRVQGPEDGEQQGQQQGEQQGEQQQQQGQQQHQGQQQPAACYLCELAGKPGKFKPQKAKELGVKPGARRPPAFGLWPASGSRSIACRGGAPGLVAAAQARCA